MPSERNTNILRRGILALARLVAGRRADAYPLRPETLRRVLLVRYDRIGDAVITTPFIEALRTLAPEATIDVLASPGNAVVFRHDPCARFACAAGSATIPPSS